MFTYKSVSLILLVILLLSVQTSSLKTRKMRARAFTKTCTSQNVCTKSPLPPMLQQSLPQLNVTTSCNIVDLTAQYNYSGIVRSGYMSVGKGTSALAFLFYGKKDVTDQAKLKDIPTIIWLNGGPGSSSQLGNFQELGPLLIKRNMKVQIVKNQHSWVNNYNVLFVDQPVGTGLSYADTNYPNSFVKSMDDVASDFYYALNQLYNNAQGCFNSRYLNIPPTAPLFLFGQSYAGKYVPSIAQKIISQKLDKNGFLKGLKAIAIGDGFTAPWQILSEVGNWAYHLSLVDYQERMRIQTMLLKASKNYANIDYDKLHDDFDNVLDFVVEKAGNVNVYDIKIDGDYQELLQPYLRDAHIQKLYKFNTGIIYDSQADDVYNNLYTDFMKSQVSRVEFLLSKNVPVLIYNGQDDLIVQTSGTMKWTDKIRYDKIEEFKKQLFSAWKVNGKIVGSKKSAGLLELRIVNNAGHLVPQDCPEAALDLASGWVEKWRNVQSEE